MEVRSRKTHFKGAYFLLLSNTDYMPSLGRQYNFLNRDLPLLRMNIPLQKSRPVKVFVFINLSGCTMLQTVRSLNLLMQMKLTGGIKN